MRKTQSRSHKLSLSAETLRELTTHQTAVVKGGEARDTWSTCMSEKNTQCTRNTMTDDCPRSDACQSDGCL